MFHLVVLTVLLFSSFTTADISKNVDDLKYFYFPSLEDKVEIVYNNAQSLLDSGIKSATETIVVIDGFLSDSTSPMSTRTREAYIQNKETQTNVIVLDWGRLSGSGLTLSNPIQTLAAYNQASTNVGPIGQRLAQFLEFVRINMQIQYKNMSIIGHSLGSHIAGQTGRSISQFYTAKLARIAGLDPAGPYVSLSSPKLRKGDASFVDIYHTNAGTLGDTMDLGDVNIYVNGGRSQPGCAEADLTGFVGYCSHSYSWKFFDAVFETPVIACPCNLLFTPCMCPSCQFNCSNGILVGPNIDSSAKGKYYASFGQIE